MNNGTPDVSSLFAQAHGYGDLSDEAYQALSVADLGAQIQAAMGVPALNVPTSRGVLLTMLDRRLRLDPVQGERAGGARRVQRDRERDEGVAAGR